jgi:Phage capsid family
MTRPLVPEDLPRFTAAAREGVVNSLVRSVIATGLGKLDANVRPSDYARKTWPADRNVATVLRAATSGLTMASADGLAQVTAAFLPALVPVSAGADLLQRGLGLSLDGIAQLTVPGIAVPTADFVAEFAPIPLVQAPTSAGATLTPHKLAVIVSLTREMMQSSNAEAMVRQVLIEAAGPAIDKALFSSTAGDATRPAGLLAGITPLTPAAAGAKDQAMADDLIALTAPLMRAAAGPVAIVAAPEQALAMALRTVRDVPGAIILGSAALAAGTVIAVSTAALVTAFEAAPQIDASREAEIVMNTAPTDVVAGGVPGAPIASVYQTDAVSLRLRWPITWGRRATGGVAFMTAVTW